MILYFQNIQSSIDCGIRKSLITIIIMFIVKPQEKIQNIYVKVWFKFSREYTQYGVEKIDIFNPVYRIQKQNTQSNPMRVVSLKGCHTIFIPNIIDII